MKRFVFAILTILYILLLVACSLSQGTKKAELYNSYVVDTANDGIIAEVEWEWWLGQRINNKEAAASKKWLDGEKEIVVQYSYSDYLPFSCLLTDFYNGEECMLSYCADNGKLVGVHYSNLINKDYYQKKDMEDPYHFAKENDISVISFGHYQSETVGPKAVMKYVENEFNLQCEFVDLPTGM